jgi:1,4-dihydroxy-2-naphthoate octaprenyltransferase
MTRPGFLTITLVGCLLGLATAAACGCGFDTPKAVATVVLAVLAHAGANVLNDYHDARNGADAANAQGLFPFTGGSRLIQNGLVSEMDTGRWAWVLLGLVMVGGLLLAVNTGGGLLLIGLMGVLLAWAYSAPPLALMSRGLGELTVALCWWLVVVGADYVQRHRWEPIPAYVAVSYALLVANILLINGLPDARADRSVGKLTLAARLDPMVLAGVYAGLMLLAHAWLAVGVWLLIPPMSALWGLVSLPLGMSASVMLFQRAQHPEQLRPVVGLTIATAHVHGLAMAAGILSMRLG